MNDIAFELLKLAVMIAVAVAIGSVVPALRELVKAEKVEGFRSWAQDAVKYAEQFLWAETGGGKKDAVRDLLREIRTRENLPLTNQQIDILIEAAVKQMKIDEGFFAVSELIDEEDTESVAYDIETVEQEE